MTTLPFPIAASIRWSAWPPAGFVPTACGHRLDASPDAFGELHDASALADDGAALRERLAADGYLFLRGYLDRAEVLQARREITDRLAALGWLNPAHPAMDAVAAADGSRATGGPDPDASPALGRLLYTGRLMALYGRIFGGEKVRHYDYTWLRTVRPGNGTRPHCDVVYMGRGTRQRLCTAWVPIGDVPVTVGGLIVLEGSHRQASRIDPYLRRDVDAYCTNRPDAPLIASGAKQWQDWDGSLTNNPASLREKLGGRWLTADFRAGDLLTFGMATVHGSLDNPSGRVRISSDSRYQPVSEPVDERWVGAKPVGHGAAGKRGRIC